jgi:hypothetical protein
MQLPIEIIASLAFQAQRFGNTGGSYVHPLIASVVAIATLMLLTLPRRYVIAPFLAAALLVPMDQVIVLGGLHFQMIRVLVLGGWIRVLAEKVSSNAPWLSGGVNLLDKAVALGAVLTAIDTVLLWQTSAAFTNQLGMLYTTFGIYFLLRVLIRDTQTVVIAVKVLAYICLFVATVMTIEQLTGHNPYAYVWAGASAMGRTVMERDGRFRAMGCFAHPLLAGTFGGISLALFIAVWLKDKKNRFTAAVGMVGATVIVLTANSSTPLLAYFAAVFALCFWPVRQRLRTLRWALVIGLTFLHLVMKAPVWALIARIDVTGSSSGYHRYQLVDQFIRHFGDWWLVGTQSNAKWGWDMWDLANQYVAVGETSGLLPFVCFLATIIFGFQQIGRARRAAPDRKSELFLWALGAALFSNVVAFFGISYYDQTIVAWYLLLAMIPAACAVMRSQHASQSLVISEDVQQSDVDYDAFSEPVSGLKELLARDRSTQSA